MKGIDVSKHQGKIDWKKVKEFGIDFAMLRAGLGTAEDTTFEYNIINAQKNGILVGIYWFCYALNTMQAVLEANYCMEVLSKYKINLPIYYDFEYATEDYAKKKNIVYSIKNRTDIIETFCEYLKKYNYNVGIYTNLDYIYSRLDYKRLQKYSLWLAAWLKNNGNAEFSEVNPASVTNKYNVEIWQFGKTPNIKGVNTDCDINYGYFSKNLIQPLSPIIDKDDNKFLFNQTDVGKFVKVKNIISQLGRKRSKTYGGSYFTLYYDKYQIISVNNDRVVIGINGVITAAVNQDNLIRI